MGVNGVWLTNVFHNIFFFVLHKMVTQVWKEIILLSEKSVSAKKNRYKKILNKITSLDFSTIKTLLFLP